ncbi:MAG: ABC transporter ATP-binding protein [Chloroflexota bacterium]
MRGSAFGAEYQKIDVKILKRLLVFLKKYKSWAFLAFALAALSSALGPVRPYLTKVAIDDSLSKHDWKSFVLLIGAIFALLIVGSVMRFFLTFVMQRTGQRILLDIRMTLFDKVQKLPFKYFDKNPVGRTVTRLTNDVETLNDLFSSGIVMIAADLLLLVWIVVFMFYTEWKLTLITLALLPLLVFATTVFRRKVRVLFRELRKEIASMNGFLSEFFAGISTVKLFARESEMQEKFNESNSKTREINIKTVYYYAIFFPTVEMLSAVGLGLIIWYASRNILSGSMTVGIIIAFVQYAEMFFRPIRDLSEKYTTMQNAMASSERIFGLLDEKMEGYGESEIYEFDKLHSKIEFKNVSLNYDGTKWAVKDLNFEIRKGETVAIIGSTGSGKTTLINILCKFYNYQEGECLIDGRDLRNIKTDSLRSSIALVMQDVFLFSRSIRDNICFGSARNNIDCEYAARELGADKFINELPGGYDAALIERGQNLSVGQRQLLSFCRAFAANPDILILDEATSNIDSETEAVIERALDKLLKGRTSIIIAHRLSTIKRADRIIVMHKGEIKEMGSHKELMARGELYRKLYELQYAG